MVPEVIKVCSLWKKGHADSMPGLSERFTANFSTLLHPPATHPRGCGCDREADTLSWGGSFSSASLRSPKHETFFLFHSPQIALNVALSPFASVLIAQFIR